MMVCRDLMGTIRVVITAQLTVKGFPARDYQFISGPLLNPVDLISFPNRKHRTSFVIVCNMELLFYFVIEYIVCRDG